MSPKQNHPDPVAADAFVHLVADQLVDGLGNGLDPVLVHVSDNRSPDSGLDELEIGVKPLDGHHPSDLLVGFTAPAEWHALGVATRGFAYPIAERGSPRRRRTRVDVVALVSRTGELAHRVHFQDDSGLAADVEAALGNSPDDAAGEQLDLLRLALGLGTDDPPCASDVFWTIEWLSDLLGAEAADLRTWADVTDRHPAMALLRHADRDTGNMAGDFLDVAATFGRVFDWRRLRSLVSDGRVEVVDLVPSDATWFDDGGFARFVLSRCPPLAMLRTQVDDQLDDGLADRLRRTLDDLGIPSAPWPDTAGDRAA